MRRFALLTLLCAITMPTLASAGVIGKPVNNLGLIAYWPLNEGSGTIIGDASGNGISANVLGGTSWTTGRFTRALNFNGTQYASTTRSGGEIGSNSVTECAWVKINSFTSGVFGNGTGAPIFATRMLDANKSPSLVVSDKGDLVSGVQQKLIFTYDTGGFAVGATGSTTIETNRWYFMCGVFQNTGGNGTWSVYLDGVKDNGADTNFTLGSGSVSLPFNDTEFMIGRHPQWFSIFRGALNDVRIFRRALSGVEIATLYKNNSSRYTNSAASDSYSSLNTGLQMHWTFDGPDITTFVWNRSSVQDANYNFVIAGGSTSTMKVPGKIGQALSFDGVDDRVMNQTTTLDIGTIHTSALWVNWQDSDDGVLLGQALGDYQFYIDTTDIYYNAVNDYVSVPRGDLTGWHHLAVTRNGTSVTFYKDGVQLGTTQTLGGNAASGINSIGAYNNAAYPSRAIIDDVRVYSRILSAAEIKQLAQLGTVPTNSSSQTLSAHSSLSSGLMGFWSFDGLDFTDRVYDRSGQGNHGSLGQGGTSTVKIPGKIRQAVNFNNRGNYIDVGNSATLKLLSGGFSVSSWTYATSTATQMFVFHGRGCSQFASYWLSIGGMENQNRANKYAFGFNTSNSGGTVQDVATAGNASISRWVHLVGTYNGSSLLSLYVDGVLQATASVTGNPYDTSDRMSLGADPGCSGRFPAGGIDDVRIYSRTLSASEAKQLYNMGR